ncbi:hypothetical protein B4U80_04611 [Leptotrombidium deliense]|uniref:Uncharacterized protein n=1 Tax=Leptotrombidium deliense TaxID=299467 RepID=A0A443SVT3_9ACAR|nr:hypothetical protein B4U80_04611 [Leptotrombidium deliense]
MSAEVSFTKRAAAELSRCFNGLTVSRGNSSKKSPINPSSSSNAANASNASSAKEKEANSAGVGGGNKSQPILEETSLLLSGISAKVSKTIASVTSSSDSNTSVNNSTNHCKISPKRVNVANIAVKCETLISKTNTTITPFKSANCNPNANVMTGGKQSVPGTPSRKGPPPRAPPKTQRARRKNYLLSLRKPFTVDDLWMDSLFLNKFFNHYTSKERCVLSQIR